MKSNKVTTIVIISSLLLITGFLKEYSENKINQRDTDIIKLQNNLNSEALRTIYYASAADKYEFLSLYTEDKNIDIELSNNLSYTNLNIDTTLKEMSELRKSLNDKKIKPTHYYSEMLKINSKLYVEYLNKYNEINLKINNKTEKPFPWSLFSNYLNIIQLILILGTIITSILNTDNLIKK